MTIEDIKKAISDGHPIMTTIGRKLIYVLGCDDERQAFFCRTCGDFGDNMTDRWIPYSNTELFGECWFLDNDLHYKVIEGVKNELYI